jgi:hypothetical protein
LPVEGQFVGNDISDRRTFYGDVIYKQLFQFFWGQVSKALGGLQKDMIGRTAEDSWIG